jgi:hypothetical protein
MPSRRINSDASRVETGAINSIAMKFDMSTRSVIEIGHGLRRVLPTNDPIPTLHVISQLSASSIKPINQHPSSHGSLYRKLIMKD